MTELPVHYDIYGRRYNFSARNISVRADQGGAEVFSIKGRCGTFLILDFSEQQAEVTYRHAADQIDPACEDCGWYGSDCRCAEIDALQKEADDLLKEAKSLHRKG